MPTLSAADASDLFRRPPERFLDAKVETTIFDCKVVYSRK
jgi:predicted amidohydrolase YtcJ